MNKIQEFFATHGRQVRFVEGAKIFSRGDIIDKIYRVKCGSVLIHSMSTTHDRSVGIDILRSGGIFGFVWVINNTEAEIDATALTDLALRYVDRYVVEVALRKDLELTNDFLRLATKSLTKRIRQIEELATLGFKSRLARWLLREFLEHGIEFKSGSAIQLGASQKLIAAMTGGSREATNRQLKKWVAEGVIAFDGGNLRILRPDAIRRVTDLPQEN